MLNAEMIVTFHVDVFFWLFGCCVSPCVDSDRVAEVKAEEAEAIENTNRGRLDPNGNETTNST